MNTHHQRPGASLDTEVLIRIREHMQQYCPSIHPTFTHALDTIASLSTERHWKHQNLFEGSFRITSNQVDWARFSYGFPWFHQAPEMAQHWVSKCFSNTSAKRTFSQIVRMLNSPCVSHVLVGATGSETSPRLKLYVQFQADSTELGLCLIEQLTGATKLRESHGGKQLHLLAIDHGEYGVVGVRIYFSVAPFHIHSPPHELRECELLNQLAEIGFTRVTKAVAVHRIQGPNDHQALTMTDISIACSEDIVAKSIFEQMRCFHQSTENTEQFKEFFRMPIALRWITAPLHRPNEMTVYYTIR